MSAGRVARYCESMLRWMTAVDVLIDPTATTPTAIDMIAKSERLLLRQRSLNTSFHRVLSKVMLLTSLISVSRGGLDNGAIC